VAHPPASLNGLSQISPCLAQARPYPIRYARPELVSRTKSLPCRSLRWGQLTTTDHQPADRVTSVVVLSRGRASLVALLAILIPTWALAQGTGNTYINPRGLVTPTGYTHVVVAADRRTVYIAGQVAFDSTGKVVGGADFVRQAEQVFINLGKALGSVGASFGDVVKMTTLITDVKNVPALREIRSRYLHPKEPPANTLIVAHLVRPDLLLEIEAVAVLSQPLTPGR
jgi:enamine deaminase RidA (YjgF/YER057c/UK114 family)